jgi:hypothetical protein
MFFGLVIVIKVAMIIHYSWCEVRTEILKMFDATYVAKTDMVNWTIRYCSKVKCPF